jgi:hypothetical protein
MRQAFDRLFSERRPSEHVAIALFVVEGVWVPQSVQRGIGLGPNFCSAQEAPVHRMGIQLRCDVAG